MTSLRGSRRREGKAGSTTSITAPHRSSGEYHWRSSALSRSLPASLGKARAAHHGAPRPDWRRSGEAANRRTCPECRGRGSGGRRSQSSNPLRRSLKRPHPEPIAKASVTGRGFSCAFSISFATWGPEGPSGNPSSSRRTWYGRGGSRPVSSCIETRISSENSSGPTEFPYHSSRNPRSSSSSFFADCAARSDRSIPTSCTLFSWLPPSGARSLWRRFAARIGPASLRPNATA